MVQIHSLRSPRRGGERPASRSNSSPPSAGALQPEILTLTVPVATMNWTTK